MALTKADVSMWAELARAGQVPSAPRVLEIGQANWWGESPVPDGCEGEDSFAVARAWYARTLGFSRIVAVDLHGVDALVHDLNEPLRLDEDFDIVINTGTSEHVFDQRQLMTTIHDHCVQGGLMVHAAPWQGWEDHGFYSYQPCFFRDLARANDYEVLYAQTWTFAAPDGPRSTMIYVALKKTREAPFRVPRQGRYQRTARSRA